MGLQKTWTVYDEFGAPSSVPRIVAVLPSVSADVKIG